MLKVGIIGYGGRISHMAHSLQDYAIPFCVAAIADPRWEVIQAKGDPFLEGTRFYADADEMLANSDLDGVMIGTRCRLHTDMACKVAPYKLPLFLEKPVAITFDQLKRLADAFTDYPAPTVISFPLRVSPLVRMSKEIIDSGEIGSVEQIIAFNDVPYGDNYFGRWYRDYSEMGGLFLQKATHDLDYIQYLMGQQPMTLCAMKAQRVYGGREDKPFDLKCRDCEEWETCPESPFNLFYQRFVGNAVNPDSDRMCLYSKDILNEDISSVLIEYANGAQLSYTQNVFARHKAARRGARLYGYKGTLHFDWYENAIHVYKHQSPVETTIRPTAENMSHAGGDRELCLDFLMAMRDGKQSRTPIETGILSALTCLWARESAENKQYYDVVMPQ